MVSGGDADPVSGVLLDARCLDDHAAVEARKGGDVALGVQLRRVVNIVMRVVPAAGGVLPHGDAREVELLALKENPGAGEDAPNTTLWTSEPGILVN